MANFSISLLSATLPKTTFGAAAAAVGTKIYVFGGHDGSSYINTIRVFDTTDETVTTLSTKLPRPAGHMGVATVGTRVFLAGGWTIGSEQLNTIFVFDASDNSIRTVAAKLPKAADGMAAAAVGSNIYIFGGQHVNKISVLDTTTNALTTLSTTLPRKSLYNMSAVTVGTKIYLFGGSSNSDWGENMIQVFDTTDNSLTTLSATLPEGASHMGVGMIGSKIYLLGGYYGNPSELLNTIIEFDPDTNAIATLDTVLPQGMAYMGSASANTKIYLFGGKDIYVFERINTDTKPVYLRKNGEWVKQNAYQKQGGVWVKISSQLPSSIVGTWVFNDVVNFPDSSGTGKYDVGITYNVYNGNSIVSMTTDNMRLCTKTDSVCPYIFNSYGAYPKWTVGYWHSKGQFVTFYYENSNVADAEYYAVEDEHILALRTFVITTEITDETFTTWLKANAKKQ